MTETCWTPARVRLFEGIVGKLQPILSRLPKRIEEISLMRPEDQEEARHRFLEEIGQIEREARDAGFDIDAAAEMLEPPPMPKPAVTLEQLEHMMQDAKARLPQLSWDTLDAHTYQALLPGMQEPLRVAVSGDVFDDHSDSHTLFSYGGAFFERTLADSMGNTDPQPGPAVCWLDNKRTYPAFVVNTLDGLKRPETLSELRATLRRVADPADSPEPDLIRIA